MNTGMIVLITVLAALAIGIASAAWLIRHKRRAAAAALAAMSPHERELHDAKLEYDTAVKNASKSLASAKRAYDGGVKKAERVRAAAQSSGQRRIGVYRGSDGTITLYEDRLTYGNRTFKLDPSFRAAADTAGNLVTKSRSTLTRMAVGGLLLGPVGVVAGAAARKDRLKDNRELYLLVESDEFSAAVTCKPEDGAKVRQFAAQVMTAARQADAVRQRRDRDIAVAQQHLEATKAATGEVAAAQRTLEAAQANTSRVQRAQAALEAAPRTET